MESSRIIDVNRERALESYEALETFMETADEKSKKKMRGYCRKLPATIQANGLVETLLYIESKKSKKESVKNEYDYIYEWMEDWIIDKCMHNEDCSLISTLVKLEIKDYRRCTAEIISLMLWYKKNAEGLL